MKRILQNSIYLLITILAINILSYFLFFRLDFTMNKRYSLSKVSKNIVKKNTLPVTVDFYITEDLPQDIKKLAKEFQSMLKEYKSLSNVSFTVNTINPNTSEKEFKANRTGIQPLYKEIRERDLEKIQKIYIGAMIRVGNSKTVLPQINYNTPIEYELTRKIGRASCRERVCLYV